MSVCTLCDGKIGCKGEVIDCVSNLDEEEAGLIVKVLRKYGTMPWHSSFLKGMVNEVVEAAKILANLIVMGSTVLARAVLQAYRQALANASKTGVAQETLQNAARRAGKAMTEQEARQILGVTEETPWEEILKKYENLFEKNAQVGSFYLQSKIHRAKECLEATYRGKEEGPPSSSASS